MGFPYIVPTIDEPMSAYTAMVFVFLFAAIPFAGCIVYSWMKREIRRIDKTMKMHDDFVINISKTINDVCTDVAVTLEKVDGTHADINEMKESLAGINKTLWEQFVK